MSDWTKMYDNKKIEPSHCQKRYYNITLDQREKNRNWSDSTLNCYFAI